VRARLFLTVAVPLVAAGIFSRLGVWQLARLRERRAFNSTLVTRLAATPVSPLTLSADTSLGHYRRVAAKGVYLYYRELAYAGRSRHGSPGVDLLTPLQVAGTDTVVIVNRGWVYSPNAQAVEFARWRERGSADVGGYAETYTATRNGKAAGAALTAVDSQTRTVHALDRDAIERAVGRPVSPYLLVQTSDTVAHVDSVPVRLTMPALDEGPHASYAVQWFSFAAIALIGGGLLVRGQRTAAGIS
jgi:surfeit locus 1 family protein